MTALAPGLPGLTALALTNLGFASPSRLWLLLLVAALVGGYVLAQRRRTVYAVRFTALPLLERVAPRRPGWRRHLPAVLFAVMLALLVVGFARPSADVRVPRERATVIVAVDVSRSMLAEDVDPDRLTAAREAAAAFVGDLPRHVNVGLVAFAGEAATLVAPGEQRAALRARIETLDIDAVSIQGTAIGEAIAAALTAVRALDERSVEDPPPARVVLLSDGANTIGRSPQVAAEAAAEAGLPVDTISFGTPFGQVSQGFQVVPVPVDGATLRDVAGVTGGSYREAATAAQLREAYRELGSSVGYRTERQDVSARFIGVGLVLAFAAALASLAWFARLP